MIVYVLIYVIYVNHICQTCPFWSDNASVCHYGWRLTLGCHQNLWCNQKNDEDCGLNRPQIAALLWSIQVGGIRNWLGRIYSSIWHPGTSLKIRDTRIRTDEDIISETTVQVSSANTGPLQHCKSSMIVGWVDGGSPRNRIWKSLNIH